MNFDCSSLFLFFFPSVRKVGYSRYKYKASEERPINVAHVLYSISLFIAVEITCCMFLLYYTGYLEGSFVLSTVICILQLAIMQREDNQ